MSKKNKKTKKDSGLDPYAIDRWHKVPFWLKVSLLKWWFFGAVYFFIFMGLLADSMGDTASISDYQYELLVLGGGAICGAFYDWVINKIITLWETDKHEGQYYSMIISKKLYSMFINIAYYMFIFILVYFIECGLVLLNSKIGGYINNPISYGLLVFLVDSLFLLIKYGIKRLVRFIKNKKNKGKEELDNNPKIEG